MRRTVLLLALVALAVLLASGLALATSPEDRDPSFDGDGRVVTDFSTPEDARAARINDVAVQPNGKIVAGGYVKASGSYNFVLARYDADSSPDETFGGDGRVTGEFNGQGGMANAIAIQPDGKIVLAGEADDQHYDDAGLARYNPDGSPDTNFSGDGSMNVSVTGEDDEARGVAVQPNGKILVSLYSYYGAVLYRLESDGTFDRSFGEHGTVENPDVPAYKDLVIQEDGKIVAQNYRDVARRMWGVTRYNRDGTVDRSLAFHYGWGRDEYPGASAMAVQPDGKVVLAGSLKGDDGLYDFALTRHLGAAFQDDTNPKGSVTIDNGRTSTRDRTVQLRLEAKDPGPDSSGVSTMRVKYAAGDWTKWLPYERSKTWRLTSGVGNKTVYVQYRDLVGNISVTASDGIRYRP